MYFSYIRACYNFYCLKLIQNICCFLSLNYATKCIFETLIAVSCFENCFEFEKFTDVKNCKIVYIISYAKCHYL